MGTLTEEERILEMMTKATNYQRWIFWVLRSYVGDRVLEVGGGVGNLTWLFVDRPLVVSTDITDYNIQKLTERFKGNKNFFAVKTDISKSAEALRGYKFDTIVCSNVLEHIEDDSSALKNMYAVLEKGGKLALLVPAFKMLYGSVDISTSHYRRYSKEDIIKKVKDAGFDVVTSLYMNVPGFFGWYYYGKIVKAKSYPEGKLSLFNKLVPIFAFIERVIHPPIGLSVVIIAEKKF